MSEPDFQPAVLSQMRDLAVGQAEIATDMTAVKEHLKTLDGKVASHEKELNERRLMSLGLLLAAGGALLLRRNEGWTRPSL